MDPFLINTNLITSMYTAIKILSSFICFMMLSVPTAFSLGPERRQEQFSTIPGYLVFPAPYVFQGSARV